MTTAASAIGHALRHVRPGPAAAAVERFSGLAPVTLTSSAFHDGGAIPIRFTADGAGLSPPLRWAGLPEGTRSLALLVEDVDAPFPRPLVHLVLHGLPPTLTSLAEGAVPRTGAHSRMFKAGRNSFGRTGWLPPSPIPGHGPHRYIFQIWTFSSVLQSHRIPGRGLLLTTARRQATGVGRLVGTYERA